jgi:hypothetical protein
MLKYSLGIKKPAKSGRFGLFVVVLRQALGSVGTSIVGSGGSKCGRKFCQAVLSWACCAWVKWS